MDRRLVPVGDGQLCVREVDTITLAADKVGASSHGAAQGCASEAGAGRVEPVAEMDACEKGPFEPSAP